VPDGMYKKRSQQLKGGSLHTKANTAFGVERDGRPARGKIDCV